MAEQLANGYCFLLPDADNPDYKAACSGIVTPRFRVLPKGTRLYRFGHSVDARRNNVPPTWN